MAIVIDGIIGAGKTTVADFLCGALNLTFYEELSTRDTSGLAQRMLDRFYEAPERWSAVIQIMFLNQRFSAIKEIEEKGAPAIIDRSIYGDEIFARTIHNRGQMLDDEFEIYQDILSNMLAHIQPPELLIYLDVSVETAMKRIKKRNRSTEGDLIPEDYMVDLRQHYEEWFHQYNLSNKIRIDFNEDAMTAQGVLSDAVKEKILQEVRKAMKGRPSK